MLHVHTVVTLNRIILCLRPNSRLRLDMDKWKICIPGSNQLFLTLVSGTFAPSRYISLLLCAHCCREIGFVSEKPPCTILVLVKAALFPDFSKWATEHLSWPPLAGSCESQEGVRALNCFAVIISPKFLVLGPGTHRTHTYMSAQWVWVLFHELRCAGNVALHFFSLNQLNFNPLILTHLTRTYYICCSQEPHFK